MRSMGRASQGRKAEKAKKYQVGGSNKRRKVEEGRRGGGKQQVGLIQMDGRPCVLAICVSPGRISGLNRVYLSSCASVSVCGE